MQHAIVGESLLKITRFILHILCSKDGFFSEYVNGIDNRVHVRCKYSGRLDQIRIITHESHIHGHRFDGHIIPVDDSFAVDGLLMYVRQQLRPISRCKDAVDDPETLFWNWTSAHAGSGSRDDYRDCFTACLESVATEKRTQNRG